MKRDARWDEHLFHGWGSHGGYAGLPLLSADTLLGVMGCYTQGPHDWTRDEIVLLSSFAAQAAIAMKNAELYAQAKESGERLESFVRGALDGIITVDLEGRITSWNPSAETVYGYSESEVVGQDFLTILPDAKGVFDEIRARIRAGETNPPIETVRRRKDGSLVDLSLTVSPVRDSSGNFVGVSGINRDITERKRAEEALRLTQFSVDRAGDATYWIGSDGRLFYVNDAACKMLGYSREELLTMAVWDIDTNRRKEEWLDRGEERKRCKSYNLETRHIAKDGRAIPVEVSGDILEFGGKEYIFTSVRDITERKEAEAMLETRSLQDKTLVDTGIRALEVSGITQLLDEAVQSVAKTLGTEFSEILEFLPEENRFLMTAGFGWKEGLVGRAKTEAGSRTASTHALDLEIPVIFKDIRIETRLISPPHHYDHELVSGITVHIGTRENPYGTICAHSREERSFDGDEIRFLQQMANILGTVIERTRTEEALHQKESQLLRSEKLASIGTLISGVAHEILNPVQIISMHVQMAQMDSTQLSSPEKLSQSFKIMKTQVERITRITKNLLDFSRQREPQVERLDPRTVLDGVLNLLEYQYRVTNIEIVRDYAKNLPLIEGDRDQLGQVFLNLLGNAKDAMPDRGRVTLRARRFTRDEKPWVRMAVEDTGGGIPKDILNRIFDPFFTTKPEGKGTGLGLSISYGIVETHDGRLSVQSQEGKGTTFFIELPAHHRGKNNGKDPDC